MNKPIIPYSEQEKTDSLIYFIQLLLKREGRTCQQDSEGIEITWGGINYSVIVEPK